MLIFVKKLQDLKPLFSVMYVIPPKRSLIKEICKPSIMIARSYEIYPKVLR